jgi:hypothetical protein
MDIYACYFYKYTVKVGGYVLANLPDSLKSHFAPLNRANHQDLAKKTEPFAGIKGSI